MFDDALDGAADAPATASLGGAADDALAAAVLRAALQKERPAAVEPEPVVEQPRMSLRDHRRAERKEATQHTDCVAKTRLLTMRCVGF